MYALFGVASRRRRMCSQYVRHVFMGRLLSVFFLCLFVYGALMLHTATSSRALSFLEVEVSHFGVREGKFCFSSSVCNVNVQIGIVVYTCEILSVAMCFVR